jgi:hypothetical protein
MALINDCTSGLQNKNKLIWKEKSILVSIWLWNPCGQLGNDLKIVRKKRFIIFCSFFSLHNKTGRIYTSAVLLIKTDHVYTWTLYSLFNINIILLTLLYSYLKHYIRKWLFNWKFYDSQIFKQKR